MNPGWPVIIVEDELHVRSAMQQTLELAGFEVCACAAAEEALEHLSREWAGMVVTDVKMPRMDGLALLRRVLEIDPDLPVVLVTGHGDIAMAVEAMRAGAYDFIEKPCPAERLTEVVRRALEKRALVLENRALRRELNTRQGLEAVLIGRSPGMERLRKTIRNLAEVDVDVLIRGETGAGKELVAHSLHAQSRRAGKLLVALNCGALPEHLIESELFGHEPGAFTGAYRRRIGKFEHANGGTVFLDEIESMPGYLQVRLLRVLQERVIERLGSNETVPLDVRIIAATKVDLKALAREGKFREDLYYRLNVLMIQIPSLRERLEDIPLLFQHFLLRACARYGRKVPLLSARQIQELMAYEWPGNVRELQNAAERFVLEHEGSEPGLVGLTADAAAAGPLTLAERVEAYEKVLIERELISQQGNVTATYTALGIGRKTLYEKMRRHDLNVADYR
ncbi:MAG: sigma-54 dependent transcriptional regulator [Pseudomonadota bacterium]|nr:sigma-54 dependent transcriptional regulator [Pseudomonadota bacterium]